MRSTLASARSGPRLAWVKSSGPMAKLQNALIIAEAVIAVLLMAGVLIQTPKASGLGGTIGGGGDGLGGGDRTRRGPEGPIYLATRVLLTGFLICSIANGWGTTPFKGVGFRRRLCAGPRAPC